MTRHLLIVGVAAALSLAACGEKVDPEAQANQAAAPDANPAATIPTPANEAAAPDFVAKAAASDMFEISAAQVALKKSRSPRVKEFAQMLIKDHTRSAAALKAAIAQSGQAITPPPNLPSDLQDKLDELARVAEADFDKAYLDNQLDAHQQALDLLQRYAQDGDLPALKAFAQTAVVAVQGHYDQAKILRDGLN